MKRINIEGNTFGYTKQLIYYMLKSEYKNKEKRNEYMRLNYAESS